MGAIWLMPTETMKQASVQMKRFRCHFSIKGLTFPCEIDIPETEFPAMVSLYHQTAKNDLSCYIMEENIEKNEIYSKMIPYAVCKVTGKVFPGPVEAWRRGIPDAPGSSLWRIKNCRSV